MKDTTKKFALADLVNLTDNNLTDYTGADVDSQDRLYLWLAVPYYNSLGRKETIVINSDPVEGDSIIIADTPEFYEAWEKHLPSMIEEFRAEVARLMAE